MIPERDKQWDDDVYDDVRDASNVYTRGDIRDFERNAQLDLQRGVPSQNSYATARECAKGREVKPALAARECAKR